NESCSMRKQPLGLRIAVIANALLLVAAFIGCPARNRPDIMPPTISPPPPHFMASPIATAPPDFQVMPAPVSCGPRDFQPPPFLSPPPTNNQRFPAGPATVPSDSVAPGR